MSEQEVMPVNKILADARNALSDGDYLKAQEMYTHLASLGSKEAFLSLGLLSMRGENGITRDYLIARQWFERALFEGKAVVAALSLGEIYYKGLGVPVDYAKSFKYYEMLENTNNAVGLLRLGVMYELGQGVSKDTERAREYYKRSARLKNIFGRKNLGVLEFKNGNVLIGLLLWGAAFVHGVFLSAIKKYDSRLLSW